MAEFDLVTIRDRITQAALQEAELPPDVANDVAFHMTDWLDDLSALVGFYANCAASSPEQVNELLLAFLLHVPNHLAAAAKLYTGFSVKDIFGVGAVGTSVDDEDGEMPV